MPATIAVSCAGALTGADHAAARSSGSGDQGIRAVEYLSGTLRSLRSSAEKPQRRHRSGAMGDRGAGGVPSGGRYFRDRAGRSGGARGLWRGNRARGALKKIATGRGLELIIWQRESLSFRALAAAYNRRWVNVFSGLSG